MDDSQQLLHTDLRGAGRCPFLGGQATSLPIPTFPLPRDSSLNPPPYYAELREAGTLGKVRLWDGSEAWLVTRYEDFRSVLSDPRFSADISRAGYPTVNAGMKVARGNYRSFITMDAPQHTAHRRMLTGEFAVKKMESYRQKTQKIVDELIDGMIAKGGPLDLVSNLALPIPSLVICELLGVPYEDHDFFQSRARVLASHTTTQEEAVSASTELCEVYLRQLIRKKDALPQDDVMSRLIVNHLRNGELTEAELISMMRLLLIAGHETTANMTSLGVLLLLLHPDQWERLKSDPSLVPQAVEEMLRYLDPTHSGRRRVAVEDVYIRDQLVRAGEGVIALSASANRDILAFPEPDCFDITREARHHVAFGYGAHQCLGQPLARIELQTVFATLARRLPTLKLESPIESLKFKHEMFIYGVNELPVSW